MDRVKVSVIGLRRHAGLHIDLLRQNPKVNLTKIYYHQPPPPEYGHLPITNDISECFDADLIIVSSPTSLHFEHMQALANYPGYILLEKPAVDRKDHIKELYGLPAHRKSRIRVNFNFLYHDLAVLMSEVMDSGELGQVFSFDAHSSHGVAFKKDWDNTWRVEGSTALGPLETTGVHYVQFALRQFGDCIGCSTHTSCLSSRPSAVDTGIINMTMDSGTWVRIRHSYAAPYSVRFEIWGTNGYFLYDGQVASVYYPRDTFDANGLYAKPPLKDSWDIDFQTAWSESLFRSQQDIVNVALQRLDLDPAQFDRDLSAMSVLLDGSRAVVAN